MYVTKTAYDNLKALPQTSPWNDAKKYLRDEIPVTLSDTGLSTMCRDFDVDMSASEGLDAYVASSFQKATDGGEDIMMMDKVSTGSYVPSRFGTDNYEFCGVILKGDAGKTYTYRIGENDYTGNQSLLTNEQTEGNMLVGAPVHVYIDKADGDMTNLVLKGGKFRYVTQYGELAWNKAYLQIPTATVQTSGAKGIRFVFNEEGTTNGINNVIKETTASNNNIYYNLNGTRVGNPQKGIFIHNGKKVIIK